MSIIAAVIISIASFSYAYKQVNHERDKIYVLGNGMPMPATKLYNNDRIAEYKGLIDLYHNLFFNITPDDKQIEYQMKKAMYLVDNSGLKEYNSLKEQGFFTSVISSNAYINLQRDSIVIDPATKQFTFYGKEIITRLSSSLVRALVTTGTVKDIARSDDNPFGAFITNWQTISNKDISNSKKGL
jgi:conjugative transposon TraK protein